MLFKIGRAAYDNGDYYHTVLWMQEAERRRASEKPPLTDLEDIIEYHAFALFKQDNIKRALELTKQLLKLDPNHPRAKGKNYHFLGFFHFI